ncbi:mediator of DNA damage checkpoint protein 1 isoform X5 [Lepus europaeus]|uniref:mediator of DNA damage checkpoint protein 1 isoform X5 n=1 Tax=Lepus europaeus TaxID=9983 RepID=UPI002B4654A5|nr:mediator of DNA damage checkpoint protein 1 isoform X5 [Lepus europaeus]
MEDTQAIILETEDEEDTEQSNHIAGGGLEPVGRLRVFSSTHGPEKDFPLYLGKNVVGRMPDCSVALQSPSISKQHAVIEILAQGKAPLLHDCGSLNGTQILRPPKVLKPGVSHCLKDRQLILFADLLCQYHRLDIPLPCAPQGPLTIEETPRVQGEAQPQRLQLAEDSEEELDSKRCMMQDSRIASPSLATVVPESDEEGLSPALGGPAPSFGFRLDSDTDEEEGQHPVAEEASSAARRDTTTGAKLPEANGITAFTPAMKETHNGTEVQGKASNRLAPDGEILERNQAPEDTDADNDSRLPGRPTAGHLERVQPSGFMDSDTDVEEEQIPATPAVVPVKKRQIFRGVGPQGSGALGLQHVQESQARGDTDVEEDKAPLAVPLVRSHAPMVINSDTDDEEEISAALTLARLKESPAVIWNRDGDVEAGRAPPEVPLQQNQTTSGRDSDTDVEEEGLPADRTVPNGHADKDGAIVTAQSKMGPPTPNDGDTDVEAGTSSPGIHLKRSQASAPVAINTELEEEVSPGLAAVHLQKHQVPVLGTDQTEVEAEGGPAELPVLPPEGVQPSLAGDCETGTEEGTSLAASVVADVREGQLPADGDAGIDHTTAEQERALQLEAQGRSPMAQVEQDLLPVSSSNVTDLVVDTGTPGRTTQSQREGAQSPTGKQRELYMGGTEDLEEDSDDFEDVALQATQCFVDRDNQSVEDQNLEDEPTQAFLLNPPPEPASSSCSFQSSGTMDVSWELMATQPFCSTASDTSETQPIEANGFCPSPSRAIPQDQRAESLLHTEPLCQGRAMQTMEKDMGHLNCKMSPDEKTSRGDPESPDACLPEASTPPPTPLISQSQKHPAPQPLLPPSPPSVEPPILRTGQNGSQEAPEIPLSSELESEVRPQKSSPVSSAILEPHPPTPTEQSVTPKLPSRATRGRTHRSYDKTPKPVESTAPDLQPSTSTERPVTTKPTSQATRGRTRRASAKTPEPVEPPVSTDQSVTPKPSTRATRGRTCRASAKTPEPVEPPVPTEQPVTPKPAFRATRGRTCRASAKTPEPVGPPVPTEQPVTPKPAFRATRGRTCRASAKTPEPIGPPVPTEQPVTPKPSTGATLGKTRRSSEPVEPIVPEILQLSTPTEHPVTPRPTPQVTWGRTRRSSATSPEPVGPTAPDLEPPLSADQPVTPKPTCRVTRGREHQSSARTPEPVEPPVSTEQPVTPKPSTRATRGRTCRASAKTPEPVEPPVPTEQPVIPKPAFRATRGRTCRASAKTPEPVEPPVPTEQPVTPKPAFRATRGRTCRASAKTPEPIGPPVPTEQPVTPKPSTGATLGKTRRSSEPVEPIVPEILQLSTPTEHPVTPRPTPQVTWGRTRRSSATSPEPVGPTAPDLEPPLSADQPVTPKPTSRVTRGRKHQSSVKTPEQVEPTVPDLEPLTPTEQPVTPRPTSRATRGRTLRSSIKTPEPVEPTAANLEPPTTVEQPVTPKAIAQSDQSGTLRSSTLNAVPVPAPSEFQSTVSTEQPTLAPIPQASNSRGQRARRKHSSPIAPIIYKPCSALPEPKSQLSSNQRQGAVRAAESLGTIPEPAFPQLLGVPTHAPQIQKVEAAGISGVIQETPKTSPSHKRSSAPMDSPPLQKRPRRGEVSQKTVFPKEEEEDMVVPVPGKRKRDQAEEKPKGIPSCSRRRTKPHQQSAAPKVLFTGVLDVRGEQAVLALGGSLASSVAEASHLVTDRICRTVKFLCALGRGIPILSLDWLYQSRKAGCFLPPDEYVVTDPEQEKNFGFRLRDALSRARERKLLEGYEIHVTPGVQPPPPQMREIISCCGGTILPSMPRSYKPQRVVITCPQDFPRCSGPLRLGVPLLSSEFLLTGVLKQEATPEAFVFSTLELPST